jgi:threonine synthase
VVVSTAHGLKFTEFKTGYHEQRLGLSSRYANRPISIMPMTGDPEQVIGELHRLLEQQA